MGATWQHAGGFPKIKKERAPKRRLVKRQPEIDLPVYDHDAEDRKPSEITLLPVMLFVLGLILVRILASLVLMLHGGDLTDVLASLAV